MTGYDIYEVLGVQKPHEFFSPYWRRKSWKWHSRLLPLLHFGQNDVCPPDVFVNLRVLWNKALTSLDKKSATHETMDHYPTYHMLPKLSRWILFRLVPRWMYPRWFHANIELRTVYLNQAMEDEIQTILSQGTVTAIHLVVLGGGYDTRSIRMLLRYPQVTKAWELDLKPVAESKQKLVKRLYQQLPQLAHVENSLNILHVDLNDLDQLETALTLITRDQSVSTHTIILTEAVLMYLDDGIPSKILQICLKRFGPRVSWLFVDRFKESTKDESESSRRDIITVAQQPWNEYSALNGWQVVNWLIKPGGTRHMGIARPQSIV